jgi:hypothetical protein
MLEVGKCWQVQQASLHAEAPLVESFDVIHFVSTKHPNIELDGYTNGDNAVKPEIYMAGTEKRCPQKEWRRESP